MSNEFTNALASEGLSLDPNQPVKLVGNDEKKSQGQFVLDGQKTGTESGFKNVSQIWLDKTLTFEQGLEVLEGEKAKTHDITATVAEMVPTVNANGEFAFLHRETERYYVPTEHAMGQVGNWADTGTWFVQNMLVNPQDYKGREKYKRDRVDAETLAAVLRNGFRRLDQKKSFFWRVREDGTMRAMLTDRYAQVDNRWFVQVLQQIIPEGRLSHWKGDGDTLFGNILIPDTIRADSDSDYGGMLSVGNSEIGERRVSSLPSIFRAICMNGCIWGQTKGQGIRQVHRGKINLDHLKLDIKKNLDIQIPLLPQGIDRFLNTKTFAWDGCEVKPVFAQVAKDYKLGKAEANKVLKAWNVESKLTPDLGHTLFGVINAITRAGQDDTTNVEWVKFDEIGGELSMYNQDDFKKVIARAKSLNVEEVEEAFATVKK